MSILFSQLLGAFLATLVAAFAALFGHRLAVDRERIKGKERYVALLQCLDVELGWQLKTARRLRTSLRQILDLSISSEQLIIKSSPEKFRISFVEQLRAGIIEHEDFSAELVALLTAYSNSLDFVNQATEFDEARDLVKYFSDAAYQNVLQEYFTAIDVEVAKVDIVVPQMRELIEREVTRNSNRQLLRESDFDTLPSSESRAT